MVNNFNIDFNEYDTNYSDINYNQASERQYSKQSFNTSSDNKGVYYKDSFDQPPITSIVPLDYKQIAEFEIGNYWNSRLSKLKFEAFGSKSCLLPLARIKRLMKVEEEVKMVAAEVPIIFSKITEIFIEDLTVRAFINTEYGKRRIVQKMDIVNAVSECESFDFLINVIPRTEKITDKVINTEGFYNNNYNEQKANNKPLIDFNEINRGFSGEQNNLTEFEESIDVHKNYNTNGYKNNDDEYSNRNIAFGFESLNIQDMRPNQNIGDINNIEKSNPFFKFDDNDKFTQNK